MAKCAGHNRYTLDDFIAKAKMVHGNKYDYSETAYKSRQNKVKIICLSHGPFLQIAGDHLNGSGCSACHFKSQNKIESLLRLRFTGWKIERHKKIWDRFCEYDHRRYCDFWLTNGKQQVMVEFDGPQHFKPVRFGGLSSTTLVFQKQLIFAR
jgi:hypothetical protein